jgi:hypothetical protein
MKILVDNALSPTWGPLGEIGDHGNDYRSWPACQTVVPRFVLSGKPWAHYEAMLGIIGAHRIGEAASREAANDATPPVPAHVLLSVADARSARD